MRQTTAAHQQRANMSSVNKNAAFVALRPGSSAQLYEALLSVDGIATKGQFDAAE
jgi:hypothetical protein